MSLIKILKFIVLFCCYVAWDRALCFIIRYNYQCLVAAVGANTILWLGKFELKVKNVEEKRGLLLLCVTSGRE